MGVQQYGVTLQTADDPEDTVDSTGRADIDRFTDFMRALQPPPALAGNGIRDGGQTIVQPNWMRRLPHASITTASNPASFLTPTVNGTPISRNVKQTLASVTYHPYGDFLLHDMGSLGDGINDDAALSRMTSV